jgi:RND family efflux transporter MFP subunit
VAQNQAALQTQSATASQTLAGPTQAAVDSANAQVANAQATLKTALNNLQAATLVAPTSGTIASLNGTVGQWISGGPTSTSTSSSTSSSSSSSTGSAFITLSDLTSPQVSASISEADIGKIQPGQKVNFTLTSYPNRTFSGTVASILPAGTTTSNVVTYSVLVSVDKTDVTLLPDMTATVSIITQQADNATLVPNSAISFAQTSGAARSGTSVMVMRNGAPVSVPIQTGISDGTNTVVSSGLQPGDQVVTGISSGSSSSRSSSGSGNIFGFGAPGGGGGGGGGNANRQAGGGAPAGGAGGGGAAPAVRPAGGG